MTRTRGVAVNRRALAAVGAGVLALGTAATLAAPAAAETDWASVDEGLWYYTRTGIAEAHQQTTGEGMTIAVLDGVINPDAPDLVGAGVQVSGTCLDDAGTPLAATSTGMDAEHGTAVTALIVGTGVGADGQLGVRGVAPGATVLYYSILAPGSDHTEGGNPGCGLPSGAAAGYELTAAIDDAVAAGADIITTSVVSTYWSDENVAAVLRAYAAGVVVLAGIPNEMAPGASVGDPAALNGVVNVARHDIDGALPDPFPPNSEHLTVIAPGTAVRVPVNVDGTWLYGLNGGTSLATPWTAGVLALAWSLHPDATANQMIQALVHTTATAPEGGEPTHDDVHGYGPVSVPRLLAVDPTTFPDENPLWRALDDDEARPTTAAILEATGKAVPQETTGAATESTSPPADDDQADDDADSGAAALPLPAILGGAALLLVVAITTAVLLRRRATPAAGGTATSPNGEEA